MTELDGLRAAVEAALQARILAAAPCAGGDINEAWRFDLGDGEAVFVKTRSDVPAGEFEREAAGLGWLREAGGRVPGVLAVGADAAPFLALEWIEPGALSPAAAGDFGRSLAAIHRAGAPAWGALPPGAPGPMHSGGIEYAESSGSWAEHYAEQRIRPLAARTFDAGRVSSACLAAVESLCDRIETLAGPEEAPARVHGDLWGGNVYSGADGTAWLIDPKAQGAHREMDLAMLRLFGSPAGEAGFAAYQEAFPLADDWEGRAELWQLQPLLVHALYFGGGYGAAVERAAQGYT